MRKEVGYGEAGFQGIAKRPEMAGHSAIFRVAMRTLKLLLPRVSLIVVLAMCCFAGKSPVIDMFTVEKMNFAMVQPPRNNFLESDIFDFVKAHP